MPDVVDVDVVVIRQASAASTPRTLRDGLGLNVQSLETVTWAARGTGTGTRARVPTRVTLLSVGALRVEVDRRYPPEGDPRLPQHVTDRYDLRRSIKFRPAWSRRSSTRDRSLGARDGTGEHYGPVRHRGSPSSTNYPDFPGEKSFKARSTTARWLSRGLPASVGVVAPAPAARVIVEVAPAADELFVFQRTPQYCVPAQHAPLGPDKMKRISVTSTDTGERADLRSPRSGSTRARCPR
jgi:hypothetical protein